MKKILLPVLFGLAVSSSHYALATEDSLSAQTESVAHIKKLDATKMALRDLWLGHVFWVRNVTFARTANNTAALAADEAQVVENAHHIAEAIEPFYGAKAKEALFELLKGHYGAIRHYLDAVVAKDHEQEKLATDELLANAEKIADFLSKANPHLPKDVLLGLLQGHGGHHLQQIQEISKGQFVDEAKTWDAMKEHMYVIADALSDGLAAQFPEKF